MRGSIRRRGEGSWELRVYAGFDDGGRRVYRHRTVRGRRRDAERELRDFVAEIEAAEGSAEAGSVAQLLDQWWPHKRTQISPTTASSWASKVERTRAELGDRRIYEVRARHLEAWYARLLADGATPSAVHSLHRVVSVLFEQAVRWELIAHNPARHVQLPKTRAKPVEAPTPAEVSAIIAAAAEVDDGLLAVFLAVAANTGARRGELCALRWSDVDLDGGQVLIARSVAKGAGGGAVVKDTKTGSVAAISLGASVTERLRAWRSFCAERALACGVSLGADAFVFSCEADGATPIYPDVVSRRFARARDLAGVEDVKLMQFRHFAATRLLSAGVDVRTVAGRLRHARTSTTLDRYSAFIPSNDRAAADLLDEIASPPGAG